MEYARSVNEIQREWGKLHRTHYGMMQQYAEGGLRYMSNPGMGKVQGMDVGIAWIQLFGNYRYAVQNDNRHLLMDEWGAFPVMNYALNEGPYQPDPKAQFGIEDRHVILKGDRSGDLIYFELQKHGLTQGRYVDYLN